MFVNIDFYIKKPRDLSSVHRHHILIALLSKVNNDAENAGVTKQTTTSTYVIVNGIDLTFESFTPFDLGFELFGKNIFAVGHRGLFPL